MPEISVIVPVYNVQDYLRQCVESILNQSMKDYEIILIDDGSSDSSGNICDQLAKENGKITVIHKQNGGLSSARNAGIDWALKNSTSKWISFIDSDDWVHSNYLKYLYSAAVSADSKVSICNFLSTEDRQHIDESYKIQTEIWSAEDAYTLKTSSPMAYAWNKLYRKDCFDVIRFPEGKHWEDLFTTHKIVLSQKSVPVVNLPLYYYFTNQNGIVHSAWSDKNLDYYEANREYLEFVKCNCSEEFYKTSLQSYVFVLYVGYQKVIASKAIAKDGTPHAKILQQYSKDAFREYYSELTKAQKMDLLSVMHPTVFKIAKDLKNLIHR